MIQKIWVKNVRNLKEQSIHFKLNHFFLFGDNNQGKTSLLEAIYTLANGQSPITGDLKSLIHWDEKALTIGGDFKHENNQYRAYFHIKKRGQKEMVINNTKIKQLDKIQALFHVNYISADVIHLFQKDPEFRRKEIDLHCCMMDKAYKSTLKKYEKIIKQKNAYLKKQTPENNIITIFNQQLIALAGGIYEKRLFWLRKLESTANHIVQELAFNEFSRITIGYKEKNRISGDIDLYKKMLEIKLKEGIEKEKILGYSLAGPHRDDFEFKIKDKEISENYSRGINRLVSFIFKVAQLLQKQGEYGGKGTLLLDDTLAEVDMENRKKIISFIESEFQIIFCSTSPEDSSLFKHAHHQSIKKGTITDG